MIIFASVKPYDSIQDKKSQIRDMFDNIAPTYDRLNHLLSMNVDRIWRRRAVAAVVREHPLAVLDVATGTGDLALALARQLPEARITGVDLSPEMLRVARSKVDERGLAQRVVLAEGDAESLEFADGSFDAVTVAFGVRNFADLEAGYRAMRGMLRPGGLLCVLELSTPVNPLVKPLYTAYTRGIIPLMGRLVSHDARAYSYLPESIAAVPQGDDMLALMSRAGFIEPSFRRLTMGVCTLYTAITPFC